MYNRVLQHINEAAVSCGRNPSEITLVVISKGQNLTAIQDVYDEGARHFGENRILELIEKKEVLPQDIHWHLVGPIQTNKVPKLIGISPLIHSVDSLKLAEKISSRSQYEEGETSFLLQVNTSGEGSKQGFTPDAFIKVLPLIQDLPNIHLEGLMTIAPFTEEEAQIRRCFRDLRRLRDAYLPGKHLSMGMTHDYRLAIEEGATYLRIGRALFSNP